MIQKKSILIGIGVFLKMSISLGQEFGAKAHAMAGSSVAIQNEFSPLNNSLTKSSKGASIAFSYLQPYASIHLSNIAFAASVDALSGKLMLSSSRSGFKGIASSRIGIGYAYSWEGVQIGLQCLFYQKDFGEYGVYHTPVFEGGGVIKLSQVFDLGLHIFNPGLAKYPSNIPEYLPAFFRIGLVIKPSKYLSFYPESQINLNQDSEFKLGFEGRITEAVLLRAGTKLIEPEHYLGIGLILNCTRIDISAGINQQIGASLGLSLSYIFNES